MIGTKGKIICVIEGKGKIRCKLLRVKLVPLFLMYKEKWQWSVGVWNVLKCLTR